MIREAVYMLDLRSHLKLERRLFRMRRAEARRPEKAQPPPLGPSVVAGPDWTVVKTRTPRRTDQVLSAIRQHAKPDEDVDAAMIHEWTGIPYNTCAGCLVELRKAGAIPGYKRPKNGYRHPPLIAMAIVEVGERLGADGAVFRPCEVAREAGFNAPSVRTAIYTMLRDGKLPWVRAALPDRPWILGWKLAPKVCQEPLNETGG